MNREDKSMCSAVATCRLVALSAYAERGRLLVPDCVGLGDQLMAVENRKNANLVVNVLVHDAIWTAVGLAKRGRLELARRVDVHQRVADGQNFAARLLAAVENPVAVMLAKEFPQFRAVLDLRRRSSLARRLLMSFSKSSRETVSPRSASPSATRRSSYASIFSSFSCSSSHAQASTNTPAARPFCVSRSGLWLVRHCATHSESLARNSERDRTSSEDLKENMVFAPLAYDLNIVQNSVDGVNGARSFKEVA